MSEWPARLESQRLYLRPPTPADAAVVNRGVRDSFEALNRFMEWAVQPPTLEESASFCATGRPAPVSGAAFPLLAFRRSDDALIGGCGMAACDLNVPSFELGYWCVTALTGQGYITEAVVAQCRYLRESLGAERVELRMDERNERSAAVAERLGFTLEGTLHAQARDHHGELRNTRVYALLAAQPLKVR
ncbi:MAG: GNAT family N-acetyltransferase [Pseudomonadota bacterium]